MMFNNMKAYELNEIEMANVAGGTHEYDDHPNNVIRSQEDLNLYMSFTDEERAQVNALPDADSRRAKMYEIGERKANHKTVRVHGGGVSGGW